MARFAAAVVRLGFGVYRRSIGVVLPTACKHHPSCSVYAEEAINSHGLIVGARLAAKRVLRCHPFSSGGYDPVPPSRG